MARVLVTGAWGNVGRSTVEACLAAGDEVTVLEQAPPRGRLAFALRDIRVVLGDVRDPATAVRAVEGQDAVIHLAAVIPPAADRDPALARSVNLGGTLALTAACRPGTRFVLASSIAVYGDRLAAFWIRTGDPLVPSPGDAYAQSKIEAEAVVRASGLPHSVLRLTYIVSRKNLRMDPLMFHMPLDTRIEVCHTADAGRAFAAAVRVPGALGMTFDIGGGEVCRTDYRTYLDTMFRLFGLGGLGRFPATAFAPSGFHCGWFADSDEAHRVLGFRTKALADFYAEVADESRWFRVGAALVRPWLRNWLVSRSPFPPPPGSP